jgi:hypothetical protein
LDFFSADLAGTAAAVAASGVAAAASGAIGVGGVLTVGAAAGWGAGAIGGVAAGAADAVPVSPAAAGEGPSRESRSLFELGAGAWAFAAKSNGSVNTTASAAAMTDLICIVSPLNQQCGLVLNPVAASLTN